MPGVSATIDLNISRQAQYIQRLRSQSPSLQTENDLEMTIIAKIWNFHCQTDTFDDI